MLKTIHISCILVLSNLLFSQNEYINLEVTPELVEVNDYITITVTSNVMGDINYDDLGDSFVRVSSGTQISHETDGNGKIISVIISTIQGYFTKTGDYAIGPFYTTSGQRSFASGVKSVTVVEKVQMFGEDITSSQLRQPAFGVILANKKEIFEGEPLIVSSKIYCRTAAQIIDGESYVIKGVVDHYALSDPSSYTSDQEIIRGVPYLTFDLDKQLIFPVGNNELKIEPFKARLQTAVGFLNLTSSPRSLKIKPLPKNAPKGFIGGVGHYKLKLIPPEEDQKQGEVFSFRLEVEGTGNLHMTDAPQVKLPEGFELYSEPEVDQQFRFSPMGAHGKIIYTYNVLPKIHGQIQFDSIQISFFNPNKAKYEVAGIVGPMLNVKQNKNYKPIVRDSVDSKNITAKLPSIKSEKEYFSDGSFYGSSAFWISFGTPLFIAFSYVLFLVFRRRKEEQNRELLLLNERKLKFEQALEKSSIELKQQNTQQFFEAVESTIRHYFEIKILGNDPERVLMKTDFFTYLEEQNEHDSIIIVKELLHLSEQARYAPLLLNVDLQEIHSKLLKFVSI